MEEHKGLLLEEEGITKYKDSFYPRSSNLWTSFEVADIFSCMVVEDIHTYGHGSGKRESRVPLSWWNCTGVTLKLEKEIAL